MLQTRKRYPLIEMPPEGDYYGLIIDAVHGFSVDEGTEVLDYIATDALYQTYSEIKNLLSDDEGYPVFLSVEFTWIDEVEYIPLRHRFVPYQDNCFRLHEIQKKIQDKFRGLKYNRGVIFYFIDLNRTYLYMGSGLTTARWCKICTAYIPSESDKEICSVCNPDTPALRSLFQSGLERRFYNALVRLHSNHIVFSKVGLKDVFDMESLQKQLTKEEGNYLWKGHIDYLVVDAANHRPIVAFEIDGPLHQLDPIQRDRDKMKNRICNLGGLALYRIPFEDLDSDMTEDQVMARISDTLKSTKTASSTVKSATDSA